MGLVGFGSVGAALLSDVVGTKARRVGGRAKKWEKGKAARQNAGVRVELAGEREAEREGKREADRLAECRETNANLSRLVGNSGSGRKRMWCLS